jgi:ADP-heptose:LPS heptosyltransferase
VQRIAVVRPNHRLGNTLLLTPLVQALQARFPDAHIELVTACSDTAAAFEHFEQVRAAHVFPTHSYRHPLQVLALLLKLRRSRYDLAVDPIPRSRAGRFLLGWLRARERVGFRWGVAWRDRPLTRAVDASAAPRHFAHAPLYLLSSAYAEAPADASTGSPARGTTVPLDLRLTEAERRLGAVRLATALGQGDSPMRAPTVAIFAHASGQKGFAIDWWRQLIHVLRQRLPDVRMLEIVPADRNTRLADLIPGLHTPQLRLLAATLAASSLVVIPDGGVMHVAEAAGARVLGLFKATDPSQYGPTRAGSEALWAKELSAEAVAERICALLETTARPSSQR